MHIPQSQLRTTLAGVQSQLGPAYSSTCRASTYQRVDYSSLFFFFVGLAFIYFIFTSLYAVTSISVFTSIYAFTSSLSSLSSFTSLSFLALVAFNTFYVFTSVPTFTSSVYMTSSSAYSFFFQLLLLCVLSPFTSCYVCFYFWIFKMFVKNMIFMFFMNKSKNVAQSKQHFVPTHVCLSVSFRNSAIFVDPYYY